MNPKTPHSQKYEQMVPAFATRSERAFDDFEPYYGLFFALLEANESILHLDADECRDGISTLLKTPWNAPLLLHGWYARNWLVDSTVRDRYLALVETVRAYRKRSASGVLAQRVFSAE